MNQLTDLASRPIIAHRGASASCPENTLAAFELAVRQGADAIELDVRLSADGIPMVIHDATVDRTTDGRGPVLAYTAAQLERFDAGARFRSGGTLPLKGQCLRIPRLAEVLSAFPEIPVLVEIKHPSAQEAVRRVLLDLAVADRCILASDDAGATQVFREAPFLRGASRADISRLYWGALLSRVPASVEYRLLSVPLRYRGLTVPTGRFIAMATRLGCPVHVWTVHTPSVARRLWARGAAGIVTNAPAAIRAARDGAGAPLPD